tara:strand:+ start:1039 stop:1185 length:147 start_codon:yes stop_codon:yes gene_type:complete
MINKHKINNNAMVKAIAVKSDENIITNIIILSSYLLILAIIGFAIQVV